MTTPFTSLPIVDLAPLTSDCPSEEELRELSAQLHDVFSTVGFAYLINAPLSFGHDEVFRMAKDFFDLPDKVKMGVAKKTFRRTNKNTYRGYFPAQPGTDPQNLKAGFEIGPPHRLPPAASSSPLSSSRDDVPWGGSPFVLTEPNCFPSRTLYPARHRLETLYAELSSLASTLLALLASSLGRNPAAFTAIMRNSVSTLRLLHYPSPPTTIPLVGEDKEGQEDQGHVVEKLSCTPHTDSGLLTLLHQDGTGGLEVRNAAGEWIPAPYVPGSIVVNVGDLLARMSGGRLVATEHRVRSSGRERYSVPFFCEPGVDAIINAAPGAAAAVAGDGAPFREMRYEEFVLEKMGTWVEFQDAMEEAEIMSAVSHVSSTGSSVVVF